MSQTDKKTELVTVQAEEPPESQEKGDAGTANKVLVRLDDVALTDTGKLTKTKLFRFLKISTEDYSDLAFTPEEAHLISQHLRFLRTGLNAAVPIYCGGPGVCPFERTCPFVKIGKVPVARVCPIEADLMRTWTQAYIDTFDVDPDNIAELSMVQELAELDIYDRRATYWLQVGEGQGLLHQQPVGVDNRGNTVYRLEVHQAWEIKERIKARKLKLLTALVGTRQEHYRMTAALKQAPNDDASSRLAALRQQLDKIRRKTG